MGKKAKQGRDSKKNNGSAGVCEKGVRPAEDSETVGVRLNIGCGSKILKGYINCDIEDNHSKVKPDVVCDMGGELPFDNGYADEIICIHALEHFPFWKHENILREFRRILKPGGLLVIEVPCMDKVIQHFLRSAEEAVPYHLTWGALYGDNNFPEDSMLHKWCFSQKQMVALFEEINYEKIEFKPVKFHLEQRDMRIEGTKPLEAKDA